MDSELITPWHSSVKGFSSYNHNNIFGGVKQDGKSVWACRLYTVNHEEGDSFLILCSLVRPE